MKTNFHHHTLLSYLLFFGLYFVFSACEKDILEVADTSILRDTIDHKNQEIYWEDVYENAEQFDAFACGQLTIPSDPEQIDPPLQLIEPLVQSQDGIICTSTDYRWALGVDDAFLYDPTADVFFLGNILDGTSIQSGAYRPIVTTLAPIRGSISLENVGGNPSFHVENPTLSSVREAIAELLRQLAPAGTPAKLEITIDNLYSSEQAMVAVRGNFRGFGTKVNASYDWNNTEVKSRLLVNFRQIYYTIDLDITRNKPSEFFDVEQLPAVEDMNGGMPVYVSSIKYGRQVVFAIESSSSVSEVKAAIQASYNSVVAGGGIDISSEHQSILESSSINAFVVGGSGEVAAENVASVNTLGNLITSGGNYSGESPGAPLSYTLRYLCDNSIAKIALASEYTVRECVDVGEELTFTPIELNAKFCPELVSNGADNEFGGNGPEVDGHLWLELMNGNEIWIKTNVLLSESNNGSTNNYTQGIIQEGRRIYTLPEGKEFRGFITEDDFYFYYVDNDHSADTPSTDNFTIDGEFIDELIMMGDTGGSDIDNCSVDSSMKISLKPITIMVGNQ